MQPVQKRKIQQSGRGSEEILSEVMGRVVMVQEMALLEEVRIGVSEMTSGALLIHPDHLRAPDYLATPSLGILQKF